MNQKFKQREGKIPEEVDIVEKADKGDDKKFKKYMEDLIEIAKDDLEVSKILYDKNYYPFAIYHLQQAAEKAAKYYFLKMGMKQEERFRNYLYSHTPIDPHVLKGVAMLFIGYKYQNIVIGHIGTAYLLNIGRYQNLDELANKIKERLEEIFDRSKNENFDKLTEDISKEYQLFFSSLQTLTIEEFREFILNRANNENFDKLKNTSKEFLSNIHIVEYEKNIYKLLDLDVDDVATILKIEKEEILYKLFSFTSFASDPKLMDTHGYTEILKLCDTLVTNERIKAYIDECFLEAYGKKRDGYLKDCYAELQKNKKVKTTTYKPFLKM